MPAGANPPNGIELNNLIGVHLRQFVDVKEMVGHDHDWLATTDLKAEPYSLSEEDETLIKSAVADLDTALDAIDMTFVNRLTGLF